MPCSAVLWYEALTAMRSYFKKFLTYHTDLQSPTIKPRDRHSSSYERKDVVESIEGGRLGSLEDTVHFIVSVFPLPNLSRLVQ